MVEANNLSSLMDGLKGQWPVLIVQLLPGVALTRATGVPLREP
jgi:hypothetical protein